MKRTKAALIYRKTGNLRAAQLLPGYTKMYSTVRNLGVDIEDALDIAESVEPQISGPRKIRSAVHYLIIMIR